MFRSRGRRATAARFPRSWSRIEPYVGFAFNYLDADFQVNARYSGLIDRTLLLADGFIVSFTGGISVRITERLSISGEAFYSPLDVIRPPNTASQTDGLFNIRSLITYRIR